ncbi:MAG: hypothetical protein IPM76_22370 [Chloroflexi bacterium]|nr:hypothetical protein [Chloroflexota bacterium]
MVTYARRRSGGWMEPGKQEKEGVMIFDQSSGIPFLRFAGLPGNGRV